MAFQYYQEHGADGPLPENVVNIINQSQPGGVSRSEPSSPKEYTAVWGYSHEVGLFVMWHHSQIVVHDEQGNYYKIETKGLGVGLVYGWIAQHGEEPGKTIVPPGWNITLEGALGFLDAEFFGKLTVGQHGIKVENSDNHPVYFTNFFEPHLELFGTWMTIKPINKDSMYKDMPNWLSLSYKKQGIDIPKFY